jgi:hypothetical protein
LPAYAANQTAGPADRDLESFLELIGDNEIIREIDDLDGDEHGHVHFVFPDNEIPEKNSKKNGKKLEDPILRPSP